MYASTGQPSACSATRPTSACWRDLSRVLTRQKMQIVEAIEDGLKSQFDIVRDVQDSRNRVSFIAKNTYDETFVIELHFVRLLYYYESASSKAWRSLTT